MRAWNGFAEEPPAELRAVAVSGLDARRRTPEDEVTTWTSHEVTPHEERIADRELTLVDIVAFFRRNAIVIFGLALGAAIIVAAVVLLFIPHTYEASATLAIVPPRFSSELKPGTLTVQGYQTLLESDAVIAETKRRLVEKGLLRRRDRFGLGNGLETRIFVSRRAEEINLAPMLQVVAVGDSPEQAAAIANTWAQVFMERVADLMAGTTSSTVKFIDSQYPLARDTLTRLEDGRVTAANSYEKRTDDATSAWDAKLVAYRARSADLVAAYQSETRKLVEEYQSQRNLATRKLQLESLQNAYGALQDEQARTNSMLQQKQLQVEALRRQMAQTPQFLTLRKAITNDALWQAVAKAKDETPDWKALQDRSLQTQEVNPVFTMIATNISQAETDYNALVPRASQLEERLGEISKTLKDADSGIRTDNAGLEKLEKERDAGLAKLQDERANGLAELTRDRQQELDAIKREGDAALGSMDRDIGQQRDLFADLAKRANQALLAKAETNVEDVRLGAPAVPPDEPRRRGGVKMTLIALIAGGVLGIGVSMIREASRRIG